jgi:spermidine synthase
MDQTEKRFFLILACFFFSGLSGLTYEILWTRMIVKIIGSAPFAESIVLAIFMGGLGLGSYIAGRLIDRIKEPLALVRLYGMLELAIGGYAIMIPLLLTAFEPLQSLLYNELYSHFIIYNLTTLIICAGILCIPVICMGATLPILCKFYVAHLSHLGTHTGRLYGLNTIGAALGSLLCGFWLIDLWGVSGTLAFALLVNGIIGIVCLKVGRREKEISPRKVQKASGVKERAEGHRPAHKKPVSFVERKSALIIFAVSGFCAMACEVLWTRLLGLIVGPSTYSFTIVLVTFITGLALGSMIFGYLADKAEDCLWLLLFTQISAALLILAVSQLLGSSQMFFAKLIFTFKDQFLLLNLFKALILFLFMILPTLCLGAAFPLVGKIYTPTVSEVGKSIGFAYMFNTIGSLLGPLCAGFLLIPLVGKETGLGMIVSLQLITSLFIAGIMLKKKRKSIPQFSLIAACAVSGLILCFYYPTWNRQQISGGKYHRFDEINGYIAHTGWLESLFHGSQILSRGERGTLVYYGDGIGGFTAVVKYADAFGNVEYAMRNSGKADATSRGDMNTQTLLAHLPMLFHKDPEAVMVLGLASGITAGEVLHYPIKRLDVLEISDQVVAASDIFVPWNNRVLENPTTNLIIQDGRAHLQLTRENYDVIISEPSNPWMAGLAALFTRDFFSLARERLTDDGIFVQWMHSYQMDWETFALIGRTFIHVFPNSILLNTDPSWQGGDYLLVGFKGEKRLVPENAEQKLMYVQRSKNVILKNPRVLYRLIVSEDLPQLFGQVIINTDDRPHLEFAAPKLMYEKSQEIYENISSQRWRSLSPLTRSIVQQERSNADSQMDVAVYALSLFTPFREMVDTSNFTPLQKERFFKLMERYCATNEVDQSVYNNDELKDRCLSIQIDVLENRINQLPDRAASLSYLASLYNVKGRTSEAISYYTEALQIDPYSAQTHSNMGAALAKEGKIKEAIYHFSEALRINPEYTEAQKNLVYTLENQGSIREKLSHFPQGLQKGAENAQVHNDTGVTLAKQGRIEEAISEFSEALRIDPEFAGAHNNLGIALARKGNIEDAIEHFQRALRINPDYTGARNNLEKALRLRTKK